MAYQGYGQGVDRGMIAMLTRLVGIVPDVTFVLDVSSAVAAARLAGRGGKADRYQAMDAAFHARVADGFRTIASAEPERCALIDADASEGVVHAAIMAGLAQKALRFGN
jgi:dTMP kinase